MMKFFRRIRQKLLSERKMTKYLIYAIGEIFLVVVGILIALQINNWNEHKKGNRSVQLSTQSLLIDLQKDKVQLTNDIKEMREDLDILDGFIMRLSSANATIDTLRHIARFEYFPFFNPSNELNRNTIISLLSTGKIDLFDEKIRSKILEHNSEQLKLLKIMDQNVSIFLNSRNPYVTNLQSEILNAKDESSERLQSAFIKGKLLDVYWDNKDDNQLLDAMLSSITGKKLMQEIISNQKKALLEKTNKMILILESSKNVK
ncbi:MAG: DUF6090 family protein [Bacteroidota bacterium]